jgi:hypothetical protein
MVPANVGRGTNLVILKVGTPMTKDERSLLFYLESCAVDQGGKIDCRRMNAEDHLIAEQWRAEGFIEFGRLKMSAGTKEFNGKFPQLTHYVKLSDKAWTVIAQERKERAQRNYFKEKL